jgi:hypothetical protein
MKILALDIGKFKLDEADISEFVPRFAPLQKVPFEIESGIYRVSFSKNSALTTL